MMTRTLYRRAVLPAFETLWKRRGTFRYLDQLNQSQWQSLGDLQQLQLDRLRRLLDHCQRHSRWYQQRWNEHSIDVTKIDSLQQLAELPITTREQMRDHASNIRCLAGRVPSVTKSTGGSSGTPLKFWIDLDANDHRVAAAYRGYDWAGAGPGTKQSYLWGVRIDGQSWKQRWKEIVHSRALHRRDVLNSFDLTESNVCRYARRLNRFRPDNFVAYVNPLYFLAREIERQGLTVNPPRSIVVGAEKLHDFQRVKIEEVFGAPVFETYGSREFTLIGAECDRHDGLHLSMENLIVEIVDDDGLPTPEGQIGKLLITDLHNFAMPFVRYEIGDQAVAGVRQCGCGRGLPLLKSVIGRQLDVLHTVDGRCLPGEFFPHLMKDYPQVRQFQVVQPSMNQIQVHLVVREDWNAWIGRAIHDSICKHVGSATDVDIRIVESIELTAAGKQRVVIGYSSCQNGHPRWAV